MSPENVPYSFLPRRLPRLLECLVPWPSRSTLWRPARSPSCAPSFWLARSHAPHRPPQSSCPSSSPLALPPPPRFEGLEECVGCRRGPRTRARRADAFSHHVPCHVALSPADRALSSRFCFLSGDGGLRRGWGWRAIAALRARRGADRAPADGRVRGGAGGRHPSRQRALGVSPTLTSASPSPPPSPSPSPTLTLTLTLPWAEHLRRRRGRVRRRLPPTASPHGRAHGRDHRGSRGRRGGRARPNPDPTPTPYPYPLYLPLTLTLTLTLTLILTLILTLTLTRVRAASLRLGRRVRGGP